MGTLATIKTKPNIYNSYFLCLTRWLIQINQNLHSQFRIALKHRIQGFSANRIEDARCMDIGSTGYEQTVWLII